MSLDIAKYEAELEEDLEWREEEIRFLHRLQEETESDKDRERFRRALILLIYAHFEGYCKFALCLYVKAVNETELTCTEVDFALAAASLSDAFKALRNPDKKCPEFTRSLPDDKALHLFAREREFVERSAEFERRQVAIPDDVIDLESNLRPHVLTRALFRLGLPHDTFDNLKGQINHLVECRNKIAHGESRQGFSDKSYEALKTAAYEVMTGIRQGISKALVERRYLRTPQTA